MPKRMLTTSEVRDLVAILRDLFSHQAQLREIQPLSSHIQFPKIPSLLSESIVFHLIDRKRLLKGEGSPRASSSRGDLELTTSDGSIKRVEIKATAESAFQYFGERDISADLLIWLHFAGMFRKSGASEIELYVCRNPKRFVPAPTKITLARYIDLTGNELQRTGINLDEFLRE